MASNTLPNMNRIVQLAKRKETKALVIGAQRALINAVRLLDNQLPTALDEMAKALDLRKIPRATLLDTNRKIATKAQNRMTAGWRSRLPLNSGSYRAGPRLTGTLGPALASPGMLNGTTDRVISFVDEATLKAAARHWYRVNYGAEGPNLAASRWRVGTFPVSIHGQALFRLRDTTAPAPRSFLPEAFVYEGQNWFAPIRGPGTFVGRGHRAARFTDLGLQAVATEFGPAYERMFDRYVAALDPTSGAKPPTIKVAGRASIV